MVIMEDKSWNLERLVDKVGYGNMDELGIEALRDIESWCGAIGGPLRARVLCTLIDEVASNDFIDSCAEAIIENEQWQTILSELLTMSETGLSNIAVAKLVLAKRMNSHPLSLCESSPSYTATVCDAVVESPVLTFRLEQEIGGGENWMFLDPENPIENVAITRVEVTNNLAAVPLADLPWIDATRAACSAFIVIV